MGLTLNPRHWRRYKDLTWLLVKYGRSDLVADSELAQFLDEGEGSDPAAIAQAEGLARDLESLGPTFVKLGQLLSTRADLLPLPYLDSLSRLQDQVEPFPFAAVEAIVQEELGVRLSKAFSDFDAQPIAAASLGQVHRAALRDGQPVAVKVQRPGIRKTIIEDLEAIEEVADFLDAHTEVGRRYRLARIAGEFRKALLRELDYRREAHNLLQLARNLEEFPSLLVPRPVEDYTSSRVLTMDLVRGRKVTRLSPLARLELEGNELAEELFQAYLKQTLIDGLFHADPHPGNIFITDERKLALLDLGMVGHIGPGLQEKLLKLLLAVATGRGEEAAGIARAFSETLPEFDPREFERRITELVARHRTATLKEVEVGRVVMELARAAGECGALVPAELTMLGKTLLNLDQVGHCLDPDFDPNESIRRNAAELIRRRLEQSAAPGNLLANLAEVRDFLARLPVRVNKILDKVADDELSIRIDSLDEESLVEGLHKVANRITLGLILAALIVGAALLMRVQTDFRILGYPGFAILCFLGAATGGVLLALDILMSDPRGRSGRR